MACLFWMYGRYRFDVNVGIIRWEFWGLCGLQGDLEDNFDTKLIEKLNEDKKNFLKGNFCAQ